ncbi:MAG: class I SAM-dependent methyltransferase [Gammaproteobacteria bacterium]|nr:class I SAM-dependent methyltransferase [Gammaproteobacteria bacterium]
MENAQYDSIAEQYRRSKSSPIRHFIEEYTFMELVGDVRGKRVLDLACGEGFYSRRLKTAGAASVLGVDISREMIELARAQEADEPQGVDYLRADAAMLNELDLGSFDIVVAAYLLHYAPDETALRRMCANIAACLPDGGRFVTLNENPEQPGERFSGYEQYGFNKTAQLPLRDGTEITYWMIAGREMFQIHARWFSRATYERALHAAGFQSIEWQPLRLDDAGIEAHGREYWQEYLNNPPIVGIECRV